MENVTLFIGTPEGDFNKVGEGRVTSFDYVVSRPRGGESPIVGLLGTLPAIEGEWVSPIGRRVSDVIAERYNTPRKRRLFLAMGLLIDYELSVLKRCKRSRCGDRPLCRNCRRNKATAIRAFEKAYKGY